MEPTTPKQTSEIQCIQQISTSLRESAKFTTLT